MLNKNPMWYIEPRLATLQELVRLQGPQACRTTRDPHRSHLPGQRGMPLQIWLEVEVGPGYFLPPEDDSYSVDYALKVLNHAYLGCTGVYLDRAGHMLAFYGQKGGSKAGLIQDVAIEAGHAVAEIPTWMGLTAKWKVRCISLSQHHPGWEKEIQRREHLRYQEHLASLHQPSRLSAVAAPF